MITIIQTKEATNLNMDAKEFFYMVAEMRSAQKAYFKTHSPNVFRAARKYENLIDAEIERVRAIVNANAT